MWRCARADTALEWSLNKSSAVHVALDTVVQQQAEWELFISRPFEDQRRCCRSENIWWVIFAFKSVRERGGDWVSIPPPPPPPHCIVVTIGSGFWWTAHIISILFQLKAFQSVPVKCKYGREVSFYIKSRVIPDSYYGYNFKWSPYCLVWEKRNMVQ